MIKGFISRSIVVTFAVFLVALTSKIHASEPGKTWPISCFVYSDLDRSGTYSLGDRPHAGLQLTVERPDGSNITQNSNIAGFTNFKLGLNVDGNIAFHLPGAYKVHAHVPIDWMAIDPQQLDQVVMAEENPQAGGKLILTQPCAHIGIAPELFVRGAIDLSADTDFEALTVTASGPDGKPINLSMDPSGHFQFDAIPGEWTFSVHNRQSNMTVTRQFTVGRIGVLLSTISLGGGEPIPGAGPSHVIQFDDLTSSDTLLEIPSGYEGLDWLYWVAVHQKLYRGAGYVNATISGEYAAYTSSGLPATFSRQDPFDFIGAHVAVAWPRGEEDFIQVQAWRGETLAYEDRFLAATAGPLYFQADYIGVNRVTFSHGIYERIVIDDLTVRVPD